MSIEQEELPRYEERKEKQQKNIIKSKNSRIPIEVKKNSKKKFRSEIIKIKLK